MGYGTRNGTIRTFWPDDTDTIFYLESAVSWSLVDIIEKAQTKWGKDIDLNRIEITAEKIHTDCLTYDLYDAGDYTNFVVIELK